jgi:UV DNA damage repair endonuclease
MMSFLTYIMGFFMNFELLPILTDYATTQESFQQSLVEIGSVVSEEKIFFKFHPPFFLFCIIGQNRQRFKGDKKSSNKC